MFLYAHLLLSDNSNWWVLTAAAHGLVYCLYYTHTHARVRAFNGRMSRTTWVSRYQKGKPIWILLEQETVSGSGISWAICKSAPCSRQITMPAPHYSVFYRPDALPAAQPTVSKHWRQQHWRQQASISWFIMGSVATWCASIHLSKE